MLDSNTDRSYFMIGAVIVGAAIIFGALFIFGDGGVLFDSTVVNPETGEPAGYVNKLIHSMFGSANTAIDGIEGN